MTAATGTAKLTLKRRNASSASATPAPTWSSRNSYGRSWRSALARSRASAFVLGPATHTGAPVGSKRRRSCSRTSASVRYVTRAPTPDTSSSSRLLVTIPYTTSATPSAAPTATTIAMEGIGSGSREAPALVHGDRAGALGGENRPARRVGLGRGGAVVVVRLELVLERRVVDQPEHVLGVARRHQDGQAGAHLRGGLPAGRGSDAQDHEVSEHSAHGQHRRARSEHLRVEAREDRDAVAHLHVAGDTGLLRCRDGDGDIALWDRQVGHVTAADQVGRRGDDVGGHRLAGRDVDPCALAHDRRDVRERLGRDRGYGAHRQVLCGDARARGDVRLGHHHLGPERAGGEEEWGAGQARGGQERDHRQDCADDDVLPAAAPAADRRRGRHFSLNPVRCSFGAANDALNARVSLHQYGLNRGRVDSVITTHGRPGAHSGRARNGAASQGACNGRGAVDGVGARAGPGDRAQEPLTGDRALNGDLARGGGGLVEQQVPAGAVAGRTPARGSETAGVGRAGAWILRAWRREPAERSVDEAPGRVAAELTGPGRAAAAAARGAGPGREARLV